jgi:hypothetical protein
MSAGFIRYKLPGDRPRRHERRQHLSSGEWNPPPIERDRSDRPLEVPRSSVGASVAAGIAAAALVLFMAPLWGVFGITPAGLAVATASTFVVGYWIARGLPRWLARVRPTSGPRERDAAAGRGTLYGQLFESSMLLAVCGWFFLAGASVVIPLVGAVVSGAWLVRSWLRYRQLHRFAREVDAEANPDLLLE